LREALRFAIFAGYRHFDTAPVYGTESLVGGVIQEFIQNGLLQRSDFFITTKLPSYANRPDNAAKLLERSLKELQTDYIDLYLIHSPMSAVVSFLSGNFID
jgi:diketogulonate reductase-like aldo/keto reductase